MELGWQQLLGFFWGWGYVTHFLVSMVVVTGIFLIGFMFFWKTKQVKEFLISLGVVAKRVKRTIKELNRKTFHLIALLEPMIYQMLINYTAEPKYWAMILITIVAGTAITIDVVRVFLGNQCMDNKCGQCFIRILRSNEAHTLSGTTWFGIGSWLTCLLFEPPVCICAMLFLICGDMTASVIGISFGTHKLMGSKSLEGFLGMLFICLLIGFNIFWNVHLREYPVFVGAFVAAFVELVEPFSIDDNLSIPVLSGMALSWGFYRISTCERGEIEKEFYEQMTQAQRVAKETVLTSQMAQRVGEFLDIDPATLTDATLTPP